MIAVIIRRYFPKPILWGAFRVCSLWLRWLRSELTTLQLGRQPLRTYPGMHSTMNCRLQLSQGSFLALGGGSCPSDVVAQWYSLCSPTPSSRTWGGIICKEDDQGAPSSLATCPAPWAQSCIPRRSSDYSVLGLRPAWLHVSLAFSSSWAPDQPIGTHPSSACSSEMLSPAQSQLRLLI
jgi:hypothetical protein